MAASRPVEDVVCDGQPHFVAVGDPRAAVVDAEHSAFAPQLAPTMRLALMVRRSTRSQRAVARMDLGTLLLPDALVLVSHGRYVVIPRSSVTHTGIDRVGTSNVREIQSVFYRSGDRQHVQHLSGFGGRPEAVEQLERWIAER